MSGSYDFDLFVIGGGSGGVRAARWAAKLGAKVGLIEKDRLGGTCVIRGCVPKKFMVYAADFSQEASVMRDYGWEVSLGKFAWKEFKDKRNTEIGRLSGLYKNMLNQAGVTLFKGLGTIADEHTVLVKGKPITTKYILIAVGSRPYIPSFEGVEHTLTSNQFFQLETQPKRVLVAGGGYIAVEFAGILQGLGSEVAVVIRRDLVLRGFDVDVRHFIQKEMQKKGISFFTEVTIVKIIKLDNGTLEVTFSDDRVEHFDSVLLAQGRIPATDELQLDKVGIFHNAGRIFVDDYFQTNLEGIYSVGDCVNQHNLTPVALREGMIIAENLFLQGLTKKKMMDYSNIPTAVFSSPPIGMVGLTEDEVLANHITADIYLSDFRPLKFSLSAVEERCLMKVIVSKKSDRVLGVHIVGRDAPEMIQFIGVALKANLTKADFDKCIGVHPTSAEELVTMREKVRSI